ncbi:MAG: HPr family phosphocarrier protein [Desulfobacterales bacterium CG23_combo_of_CG06-09_8_20_14_all_52_9]|nr:MAG: HPr family phosphocarrier protein [Desulfobacterales bacterium CG23_combo_of_CG06-09_8_20_14_all_52_9]
MRDSVGSCSEDVTIVNESGLHARSAASIARVARHARFGVRIRKGNEGANAKDVMDVLSLACQKGSVVTISIENPSDKDVLIQLVTLVQNGFGE